MDNAIDLSLDGYPTLARACASDALIRIAIGPAASAKTTWCLKEIALRAMLQKPAGDNIRYTRWVIIRQSYNQLRQATLNSIRLTLGSLFTVTEHPVPKGLGEWPLPDGTRVHCELFFLSMDAPDALKNLLGLEVTGAFLDEVSELSELVATSALERTGRYPAQVRGEPTWSGVIGATNGPSQRHWLYEWHTLGKPEWRQVEEMTGRKYFGLFQQPPALLRPTRVDEDWQPNPEAENIDKLKEGYGYYFKMLGGDDSRVIAYVEGKFAKLKKGNPVWPEFSNALHKISERDIYIPSGAPIYLSFDFGRTPVMLAAITTEYGGLIVVDEYMGEGMAISTLMKETGTPALRTTYKNNPVANAWGDPAGQTGGQATELSPFQVLEAADVPIEVNWNTQNSMEPRLEAVRVRFTTLDRQGRPMLMISTKCKYLINAVSDEYIYEQRPNKEGEFYDTPTKTHKNWVSDLCDALQYLCLGFDTHYSLGQRGQDKRVKTRKKSLLGGR